MTPQQATGYQTENIFTLRPKGRGIKPPMGDLKNNIQAAIAKKLNKLSNKEQLADISAQASSGPLGEWYTKLKLTKKNNKDQDQTVAPV